MPDAIHSGWARMVLSLDKCLPHTKNLAHGVIR
jgi:hypothetical protein